MDDISNQQWRPSSTIDTLRERAQIINQIRLFFASRNMLEVDTPNLSRHSITDPYLHALTTIHTGPGANKSIRLYLQTSPEYAMKRLLAAGSGDIFQISKAFRDDEVGRYHNPEFSLLEWYRLNFSMQDLIDESIELLKAVLRLERVEQYTYVTLFERYCGFNPLTIDAKGLVDKTEQFGMLAYSQSILTACSKHDQQESHCQQNSDFLHKDALLQAIFNQEIESKIGREFPVVVTHFPASQAALATLNADGLTANRFEIYFQGLELANGFNELQDPKLQASRFEQDNQKRASLGLQSIPIDNLFLDALNSGLPACSGIALGIDRLVMLALNKQHIREVVSFDYDNC